MKILVWSLAILTVVAGCASSSNKSNSQDYKSSISLKKPGDHPHKSSKIYADSVKLIAKDKKKALLIYGTLPDACTNLEEVTHRIQNDSLHLEFKAWRNPEVMCAQVLTPFTYIYGQLSEEELTSHSEVIINDTAYSY